MGAIDMKDQATMASSIKGQAKEEKHSLQKQDIKKILVVDDEDEFVNMIIRDLKRRGFRLYSAFSGVDARHKIRKSVQDNAPFDLVIIDLDMSQMDGYDLLEWIKAESPGSSMLIVSELNDTSIITELIRPELDAHCKKPVTPCELVDAILHVRKNPGRGCDV